MTTKHNKLKYNKTKVIFSFLLLKIFFKQYILIMISTSPTPPRYCAQSCSPPNFVSSFPLYNPLSPISTAQTNSPPRDQPKLLSLLLVINQDNGTLLLTPLHNRITEHEEIMFILTWKLYPGQWQVFVLLKVLRTAPREKSSHQCYSGINPVRYNNECPWETWPLCHDC